MEQRERETLAALKNLYDAWYQLPIRSRVISGDSKDFFDALRTAQLQIRKYRNGEIADEVNTAIVESNMNPRFQPKK